jgi:predicted nucleotidyltransferase
MDVFNKLAMNGVHIEYNDVERICLKYHISELSIFGSALRTDFHDGSDIDILVVWDDYREKNNRWDYIYIVDDFVKLLGRSVDVIDIDELTNPIRREDILSTTEVLYGNQ